MPIEASRIHEIGNWLVGAALGDTRLKTIVPELAARLISIGVPVHRCRLTWPTLHPLFEAETLLWTSQNGVTSHRFDREADDTEWRRSNVKWMVDNGSTLLRARLGPADGTPDPTFMLYDELRKDGYVDFVALLTQLFADESLLRQEDTDRDFGLYVAWASKSPEGFCEDSMAALKALQPFLALVCKSLALPRLIFSVANTYLGPTVAREVLGGRITLGSGSQVRALIWYSDLRNSTALAESMDSESYLALLNDFFDCTGRTVAEAGGEILAFVGDAVLAVFPIAEGAYSQRQASVLGTRAADNAMRAARGVNKRRTERDDPEVKFGIAMCVGEVRLGNIGIRQRLSFSVIGPSVNEVERMEKMTKTMRVDVLATEDIAAYMPKRWQGMGHVPLRGFKDTVEVFSLVRPRKGHD
ncbi:adenylate/guanylate cyclase domain-containing protein [Aliihoeflea sp. PC F10.4]